MQWVIYVFVQCTMCDDEMDGCVVRVRGLPWSASNEEVHNFFEGLWTSCKCLRQQWYQPFCDQWDVTAYQCPSSSTIAALIAGCDIVDGKNGIHFTYVRDGRPSGEAYIELASEEDLEKALTRDKNHMGKRYIEGTYYSEWNTWCENINILGNVCMHYSFE